MKANGKKRQLPISRARGVVWRWEDRQWEESVKRLPDGVRDAVQRLKDTAPTTAWPQHGVPWGALVAQIARMVGVAYATPVIALRAMRAVAKPILEQLSRCPLLQPSRDDQYQHIDETIVDVYNALLSLVVALESLEKADKERREKAAP